MKENQFVVPPDIGPDEIAFISLKSFLGVRPDHPQCLGRMPEIRVLKRSQLSLYALADDKYRQHGTSGAASLMKSGARSVHKEGSSGSRTSAARACFTHSAMKSGEEGQQRSKRVSIAAGSSFTPKERAERDAMGTADESVDSGCSTAVLHYSGGTAVDDSKGSGRFSSCSEGRRTGASPESLRGAEELSAVDPLMQYANRVYGPSDISAWKNAQAQYGFTDQRHQRTSRHRGAAAINGDASDGIPKATEGEIECTKRREILK